MTNAKNSCYIIFTVVVVLISILFFSSRSLFGDDRKLKNEGYDLTFATVSGSYEMKVTNARVDKATNTMYADFYIKRKGELKEYPPELIKVTDGDTTGDELKFSVENNPEREFANTIQVDDIPEKFYYLRLYIKTKGYDTPVDDTVDEFGNVIKHEPLPGKEAEKWVYIDYRNVVYYDSSKGEEPEKIQTAVTSNTTSVTSEKQPGATQTSINSTSTNSAITTIPNQIGIPKTSTQFQNQILTAHSLPTVTTTTPVTAQGISTQPSTAPPVTTTPKVTTQPVTATQAPTTTKPPVNTIPILIHTISLNQYINVVITPSQTFNFEPQILPSNATNKSLTWVSNKPLIATVDNNGVVIAKGIGKAIITCWTTDGTNLSASCMVTVQ